MSRRPPAQADLFGGSPQVARPRAGVPCRGCGRPILWRRTSTGKWMPVECQRWEGWVVEQGTGPLVVLLTDAGALLRTHELAQSDHARADCTPVHVRAWAPHWAVCPASDTFKRPRAQQTSFVSNRVDPARETL